MLLSRLIKYLKNNGLKIGHLQLLLDHSLQDLDLSRLSKNMGTILTTITNRCVVSGELGGSMCVNPQVAW